VIPSLPRLTPGRFTALWLVLRALLHLGRHADKDELLAFARRNGLRAGGLPIADGYALAVLGAFIDERGNTVELTELGASALERGGEDEPTQDVSRFLASVLLLRRPPTWVAYWQGDPTSLDLVLPEPSREILRDAALLPTPEPSDPESWSLWNALKAVPALDTSLAFRAEVGRSAERVVLGAEKRRLESEGFPELAAKVRWVAQESAAYGFDILSYCGARFAAPSSMTPMAIEVKATASPPGSAVSFFLTRHEWETAQRFPWTYVIKHLAGSVPTWRTAVRSAQSRCRCLWSALMCRQSDWHATGSVAGKTTHLSILRDEIGSSPRGN